MPRDRLVDGAAVGLDLGLAGAADETEPAALAFEVGPCPHQPRTLVAERGQFHLQHAFPGAGAVGKDLQDQARPVQKLAAPRLFEVPLLHRRHRAVDQDKADLGGLYPGLEFLDLARAEQHPGLRARQAHDIGGHDLDIGQRGGQRHGLFQRGAGGPAVAIGVDIGMKDHGAHGRALGRSIGCLAALARRHSSPS
jgi:hypothetical protein